jgi:hypothetical protein
MDGVGMDLTVVSGTVEGESPFYKGVRSVEVDVDVMHQRFTAIVIVDTEGDIGRASVMFEARWNWQYGSSNWSIDLRLLCISRTLSVRYWLGSVTLALTSVLTSSAMYTQPFGSDSQVNTKSLGDDTGNFPSVVVGWWNHSGIFMVFKGINEVTCQCCGLCTIEVKPRHVLGLNGGPHWESRGEVECGIWDDWGMTMAVLVLFSTPSAASEIMRGG